MSLTGLEELEQGNPSERWQRWSDEVDAGWQAHSRWVVAQGPQFPGTASAMHNNLQRSLAWKLFLRTCWCESVQKRKRLHSKWYSLLSLAVEHHQILELPWPTRHALEAELSRSHGIK